MGGREVKKREILPCPFCGSKEVATFAFSISPGCFIECANCGAGIEAKVQRKEDETTKEHEKRCDRKLINLWNRRTKNENDIPPSA